MQAREAEYEKLSMVFDDMSQNQRASLIAKLKNPLCEDEEKARAVSDFCIIIGNLKTPKVRAKHIMLLVGFAEEQPKKAGEVMNFLFGFLSENLKKGNNVFGGCSLNEIKSLSGYLKNFVNIYAKRAENTADTGPVAVAKKIVKLLEGRYNIDTPKRHDVIRYLKPREKTRQF